MANTLTFVNQTLTDENIFGGINYICDLNAGDQFSIGNTASASVSFVTDTQVPLYTEDNANGTFTWAQDDVSRGRFYVTEVKKYADTYTVTAYDAMILLDTSISALSLTYPLTVSDAATAIATYIGCEVSGTITNGSLQVESLEDMTIRQLLGHVAEASACSVKIDGSDHLCFMYYDDSGITVTASEYINLEVADYTCAAIDNVTIYGRTGRIRAMSGIGTNSLFIQGNPFLYDATNTEAETILLKVNSFVYSPFTCEMFEENGLEVGTIATFGSTSTLVMHIESGEGGAIASSVGASVRTEDNTDSLMHSLVSNISMVVENLAKKTNISAYGNTITWEVDEPPTLTNYPTDPEFYIWYECSNTIACSDTLTCGINDFVNHLGEIAKYAAENSYYAFENNSGYQWRQLTEQEVEALTESFGSVNVEDDEVIISAYRDPDLGTLIITPDGVRASALYCC